MEKPNNFVDIKGLEGLYAVNVDGIVYSYPKGARNPSGQMISPCLDGSGYSMVRLINKDCKRRTYKIHRLIAQAFIPNPEGKPQVNHKDGIKVNNAISNLEWVTSSENIKHAWDNGLMGDNKNRIKVMSRIGKLARKLTMEQADLIRSEYKYRQAGFGFKALGEKYGVDRKCIKAIVKVKSYVI